MKLVTYIPLMGPPRLGVESNGIIYDLAHAAAAIGGALPGDMVNFLKLGRGALNQAQQVVELIAQDRFPGLSADQITYLAPIPRPPKILALAGNYQEHIQEGGGQAIDKSRVTPRVFIKPVTSVIGPGTAIRIPRLSQAVDYELELAVVIGRRARYVEAGKALDYVAGYLVFNDVSARSLTLAEGRDKRPGDEFFDWLNGKWFDTFAACGPYLVTADEVGDPQQLHMTLKVNGRVRQDGSTAQMIFTVAEIIAFISQFVTLEPGDIIATGTLSGVGETTGDYLQPGDTVEASIEKLGLLTNPVKAEV